MLVGELSVDSGKGISSALNIGLVLGIKVNLHDTLSVDLDAGSLPNDFGRVDEVVQDGLVDSRQCARAWAGSVRLVTAVEGLSKNGTLGDNENVTSGELLFQLTDKSLVDLVEGFSQFVRNIEEDSLSASAAFDLLGSGNVKIPKGCLELGGGHLKVEKLLGNRGFEFIGLGL